MPGIHVVNVFAWRVRMRAKNTVPTGVVLVVLIVVVLQSINSNTTSSGSGSSSKRVVDLG